MRTHTARDGTTTRRSAPSALTTSSSKERTVHKKQVNCRTVFVGECRGCLPGVKHDPATKTFSEGLDCCSLSVGGLCVSCDSEFASFEGDKCVNCFEQDKHCNVKNRDQSCNICEEGWELEENGTCTITAPFCSTPTQDGKCSKCALGCHDKDGDKTWVKMPDFVQMKDGTCTFVSQGIGSRTGHALH